MAAGAALMLLPAGCASQEDVRRQGREIQALRAEVEQMQRKVRDIASLELRVEELRSRLGGRWGGDGGAAGPAPGDRPGAGLLPAKGGLRIRLPAATFVEGPGARPARSDLASHLRGRDAYVVAFWATWCAPCIADGELARLHALRDALSARHVELVSVAIDGLDAVRSHDKAGRWLYPLWQKDDGHMAMLPRPFVEEVGLGLPLFVVVGPGGALRHYLRSDLSDEAVRAMAAAATAP